MTRSSPARAASLAALLSAGSIAFAATAPAGAPSIAPLDGFAQPVRTVTIGAPLTGALADLAVDEGEDISKGDLLFQMDSRVAQAAVAAQRVVAEGTAGVHRAQVALERTERVHARLTALGNAASTAELEDAWSDVAAARVLLEEAREQQAIARAVLAREESRLAEHRVTAPFDGVVTRIHAEQGAIVESATAVLTLVEIERLEVALYVPASASALLARGSWYTLDAGPPVNEPLPALLESVARTIDPASQTVRCIFRIENPTGRLPSGFPVRLDLGRAASVDLHGTP